MSTEQINDAVFSTFSIYNNDKYFTLTLKGFTKTFFVVLRDHSIKKKFAMISKYFQNFTKYEVL